MQSTDLSFAEEQLWLADQAGAAAAPFFDCATNVPLVVRLEGPLNRQALEGALTEVVRRHEVLRSRFVVRHGRPVRLCRPARPVTLSAIDLRLRSAEDPLDLAHHIVAADVNRRFNLARDRLFRAVLLVLADERHLLAITVHHIVFDRWSKRVLAAEIQWLYNAYATGRAPDLEPLRCSYGDYVTWQRDRLEGPRGRQLIEYWTARLRDLGACVLPCGGDRGPTESTRAGTFWFAIPPEAASRLVVMSRRWRVTITSALLAVLMLLLHRRSGREDIAVGVPLSDRRRPDFEHLIGLFMNVVVVRTTVTPGMAFLELLDRVRRTVVDACLRQDMPCGYLSRVIETPGPLYRVVFDFMPTISASDLELPGLRAEPLEVDVERRALADLSLHVHHKSGALACRLDYKADAFSSSWIRDFAAEFQSLVTAVLNAPQESTRDGAARLEALTTAR